MHLPTSAVIVTFGICSKTFIVQPEIYIRELGRCFVAAAFLSKEFPTPKHIARGFLSAKLESRGKEEK